MVVGISCFYSIVGARGSGVLISPYTTAAVAYIADTFRRVVEPLAARVVPSDSWLLVNVLRWLASVEEAERSDRSEEGDNPSSKASSGFEPCWDGR